MKKKYLKNMTARVATLMLFFLCLVGSQAVMAQSRSAGGGAASGGSCSSGNVSFVQSKFHSPMTKAGDEIDITVNSTKYTNWATALNAINQSTETNFNIVLNADLTVDEMPAKACVFSSDQGDLKTFSYSGENEILSMNAAVTFKNIKLDIKKILANGYTLTFDEGTDCSESKYTNGDNSYIGIRNIWGGGDTNDVENTNIIIKSGQFGWICGGSGNTGNVTGTAKITMRGGTVNASIFGGGYGGTCGNTEIAMSGGTVGWIYGGGETGDVTNLAKVTVSDDGTVNVSIFGGGYSGTCGNTEVTMSGGTTRWIYGGGEIGDVTNTAKLTISGTAKITETVFGGSDSGTCGSTEVKATGGTFLKNIHGGGFVGIVTGATYVEIDGAHIVPELSDPVSYNGGNIYGGGNGEENGENDKGKVGSTTVVVKSLAGDSRNVSVFGGGPHSNVDGNTDVTIEGGNIDAVYGSGYNYNASTGSVGGNVKVLIKGGTIGTVGAARGQDSCKAVAVTGAMEIIIEGGEITYNIASGNESRGSEYKSCTLTLRNVGSTANTYKLPMIREITDMVLDNAVVEFKTVELSGKHPSYGISIEDDHPVNISGDGQLLGTVLISKWNSNALAPNKPIVIAGQLPEETILLGFVDVNKEMELITTPVYKAGKTYRRKDNSETLYTVNIATPETEGVGDVTVKWDQYNSKDVMLEDGDQVPSSASITPNAVPKDEGITAILKNGDATITSGTALTLSSDASFRAEFEIQPLDLSNKNSDITISKEGETWKYTKEIKVATPLMSAMTKAPANTSGPISFNGIIKNALADGKRMLIDGTAQGELTFEDAKINSTSTAAPALTIGKGANVSFSGSLEVQTGNADQYSIKNEGNLTITGTSTDIKAKNSSTGSDKGIQVGSDAVVVSDSGTKLVTSGMSNEGTVVVKEGAEAKTEGGADLQKTYLVTINDPGNGNNLAVKAGDIEIKSNDKVADKTVLTVTATPAGLYQLLSITATPKDGTAETLANNGTYTMPENEVTFSASFRYTYVPPVATYYTVTLPEMEGVTTNPKAGRRTVEEGYSFSFTLTLHEGYESSRPVVKANGVVVEPRESDGKYIIRNIKEDTEITIEGIVKDDPTGNAAIEGAIQVRAIGSVLHIYLPKAETVSIYTLSGLLYEQQDLSAGSTQMQLSTGMYIVKIGKKTYKIVIR